VQKCFGVQGSRRSSLMVLMILKVSKATHTNFKTIFAVVWCHTCTVGSDFLWRFKRTCNNCHIFFNSFSLCRGHHSGSLLLRQDEEQVEGEGERRTHHKANQVIFTDKISNYRTCTCSLHALIVYMHISPHIHVHTGVYTHIMDVI
jgi:hypothetical protein